MTLVRFACPKCKQSLKGNDSMPDKIFKCPSCKTQITVPLGQNEQTILPKSSSSGTSTAFDALPNSGVDSGGREMKDLTPLVERNETNGLSQAESIRDQIYDLFEQAATDRQVQLLILKSPPFTAPPWIRVECWLRHPEDSALTLRSSAELTIRPREFHRFPIEIDITLSNDKRRRAWRCLTAFDAEDANNVLDYILYRRKSHAFGFRRCRSWPLQFWRPYNRPVRLGCDPMGILTVVLFAVGFCTLAFGVGAILLLIGGIVIYRSSKRRRHILSAGKPSQEPRDLVRLDSWQTLVRGLGRDRQSVTSSVQEQLTEIKEDGFTVANENIWHWGVDGKEERVQLVARFRRSIAFVHIYSYGDDLFVGWDAHVNCGTWVEQIAGGGYDEKTKELCVIHSIAAGWYVPTEYDITDANCLLERVHAAVTKVVKLKLAEHNIDQEIDFRILREERQGVAGRKQSGTSSGSGGIQNVVSKLRRIG